jgi:hypothetical protein
MGVNHSLSHLRGEFRFMMLENRILRRIFGPNGEKVAGG